MIEPRETYYKTAIALWERGLDTMAIVKHIARRDITESVVYRWVNWHLDEKVYKNGK